jgi:hypothetical protein
MVESSGWPGVLIRRQLISPAPQDTPERVRQRFGHAGGRRLAASHAGRLAGSSRHRVNSDPSASRRSNSATACAASIVILLLHMAGAQRTISRRFNLSQQEVTEFSTSNHV